MKEKQKTMDERANEYYQSLASPLASKQGLAETAYISGCVDQQKIERDKAVIRSSKLNEAVGDLRRLEKLLTERVSDLHEVKGGMQARHAYIFYRSIVMEAIEKIY